jgi:prepilin-type N-terminal cleavage/methylation domain-containing protein
MARPTKNNLGFTLIEMLTVVMIAGVLAAISWPFLANKVFARTVPQIESTLKIVSLKARANAGNPYKVTLQGTVLAGQVLKVEYLLNGNCNSPASAAWGQDSTQTLELPANVVEIDSFPAGGFCFDGTGQASLAPGSVPGTQMSFNVKNLKRDSKVVKTNLAISLIGDVSRKNFDANDTEVSNSSFQ